MACANCASQDWGSLKLRLRALSPELCQAVDELAAQNPGSRFFVARYRYGDLIVDSGTFRSPCDGRCAECTELHNATRRSTIPLGIVLDNSIEVFQDYPEEDFGHRFAPLALIGAGDVFGVFETLDNCLRAVESRPEWSVSAGSRSASVVGPIRSEPLARKLAAAVNHRIDWRYKSDPHWLLIREVAKDVDWTTTIMVFPDAITRKIDLNGRLFHLLLETGWKQSRGLRGAGMDGSDAWRAVEFARQGFNRISSELHLYATLRHWVNILNGATPAYQSAARCKSEAGPFRQFCARLSPVLRQISKDFLYQPAVLQPMHLGPGESGFYSLRRPSVPAPMAEEPEKMLQLTACYREMVRQLKGSYGKILNLQTATFYAAEPNITMGKPDVFPTGVMKTSQLALSDFYNETAKDASVRSLLYLRTPFLSSCVRLQRQATQALALDATPSVISQLQKGRSLKTAKTS